MKKLFIGLSVWSASSVVLALPLTHGALTVNQSGLYPNATYETDGGIGSTSSSNVNSISTAQAYVTLLANGAPELKVYADGSNTYTTAFAHGIQRYEYTGTSDATLTAEGNFHAVIDNSTSSFRGNIGLWKVSETENFLNDFFGDGDISGVIYEVLPEVSFGEDSAYNLAGEFNLSATASLDLKAGDEFFLYGSLLAAADGGVVNALNTGTFAFDFAGSGITSADLTMVGDVSAVPVPAALYLFVPALLGLFGFKRKTA